MNVLELMVSGPPQFSMAPPPAAELFPMNRLPSIVELVPV